MADLKLNIQADSKELQKVFKEIEKNHQQRRRQFKQQIREEDKYNKAKQRELKHNLRLEDGRFRDQKKHYADILKYQKKGWSEETVHQRRMQREQRRERVETTRWRKSEQRELERSRRQGSLRGTAGRVVRGGAAIAGSLAGFFIGGAISSYGKHLETERARAGLMGLSGGKGSPVTRNTLRGLGGGPGTGFGSVLGYNMPETYQHALATARATGYANPAAMQRTLRATLLNQGEASDIFATLTQGGASFKARPGGTSEGMRNLQKIFTMGTSKGLEQARFPEFLRGMSAILNSQMNISSGKVSGTGLASVLAALQGTGRAGFMGARGASTAATLNAAFQQEGGAGGEWGKGLFLRAMGFGSRGGNQTDYFSARMRMAEGLTGPRAAQNLQALLNQTLQESGGSAKEGAMGLSAATKLSLPKSYALLQDFKSGKLDLAAAAKMVAKEGESFQERATKAMEENGGTLSRLADRFKRFADIGEKHASKIEAIQDLQLKLFEKLSNFVDRLEASGLLEDLGTMARLAISFFHKEGVHTDEAAAASKNAGRLADMARKENNPTKRKNLLEEAYKKYMIAAQEDPHESAWSEFGDWVVHGKISDIWEQGGQTYKDKMAAARRTGASKRAMEALQGIRSARYAEKFREMFKGRVEGKDPLAGVNLMVDMNQLSNRREALYETLNKKFPRLAPTAEMGGDVQKYLESIAANTEAFNDLIRLWNGQPPPDTAAKRAKAPRQ